MGSENLEPWQVLCAERRQKQLDSIPQEWLILKPSDDRLNVISIPEECGLLSSRELEITNTLDVDALLSKLASGEWSSVEVTTAFYKRAIIAHQLTNCLTEIFVERALERAAFLDEHLKKTGTVVGPLHGLPISVKDQFRMKGLETIMGYASNIGDYSDFDSVLIEILYDCGAVPFVRTNVPQTLMWGETHNNVFGRTTNSHNRNLTPGGSSGGEGAIVALKGSPLGVGTDIGGSIRIPATFCGLYGLRPSYERLPYQGAANTAEGQESVSSVLGPLASTLSGIKTFTKVILDSKPWLKDPLVQRKPWDEAEYQLLQHGKGEKMCFGFLWDDGIVNPTPPLWRAMRLVKKALEDAGHTVIDWENLAHMEIFINYNSIVNADGGEDFRRACDKSGEPLLQTMSLTETAHSSAHDEPLERAVIRDLGSLSAWELWQLQKERRQLRKDYLDHWQKTVERTGTGRPVDAIITPAAPFPAPPHGYNCNSFYTALWNLLDYSAIVFPVTTVDPELDVQVEGRHEFYNYEDEAVYNWYAPDVMKDSPVGLQLVGQVQEEEAVIAMTEIVDKALKSALAKEVKL